MDAAKEISVGALVAAIPSELDGLFKNEEWHWRPFLDNIFWFYSHLAFAEAQLDTDAHCSSP